MKECDVTVTVTHSYNTVKVIKGSKIDNIITVY